MKDMKAEIGYIHMYDSYFIRLLDGDNVIAYSNTDYATQADAIADCCKYFPQFTVDESKPIQSFSK